MLKLKSVLLPLALLTLPGSAAAQGNAQALYFVFKLATTLPLTVQDTPECAAEQASWQSVTGGQASSSQASSSLSALPRLMTYSFVSLESSAALRRDLDAFAQEHNFAATTPAPGTSPEGASGADQEAGRQFTDAAVTGFSYAVRVYARSGDAGPRSVLCVTMFSPPEPAPGEPSSDDI
jgi:hypothetical protein